MDCRLRLHQVCLCQSPIEREAYDAHHVAVQPGTARSPQFVEGSTSNHHIRPFPGSNMVGCVGVTRPFTDPRPIQTLHRMLTSLKGIMGCHTYVRRKILYDKPNEQDSLYLLTNSTFSASCDKIAQHDATCTACDKMLPHGEGLDWSPY